MRVRGASRLLGLGASLLLLGLAGAQRLPHAHAPKQNGCAASTDGFGRGSGARICVAIDPRTTAVAYLDRTIEVMPQGIAVVPRRSGLLLPASTGLVRIAVVRVETAADARLDAGTAESVAAAIVESVRQPGGERPAALQVDFDARRSQREWYTQVLQNVRHRMPAELPLSMTALASWCSYDGEWLAALPVDEAVPMLFRMEPDRRRLSGASGHREESVDDFSIHEPLCEGAVGISTTEAWPRAMAGKRVYVFADRGWARDGLDETIRSLP